MQKTMKKLSCFVIAVFCMLFFYSGVYCEDNNKGREIWVDKLDEIIELKKSTLTNELKGVDVNREGIQQKEKELIEITQQSLGKISRALKSEDEALRNKACQAIYFSGIYDTEIVEILKGYLKSPDEELRCLAVTALGKTGREELLPLINSIVYKDPSLNVRFSSMKALSSIGSNKSIPIFVEMLNDGDSTIRVLSYSILNKMDKELVLRELEKRPEDISQNSREFRELKKELLGIKKIGTIGKIETAPD